MLGWICIWKDEKANLHKVKVRFGNLWFYLLIYRPPSITLLENSILSHGVFYENRCSRQEKWKELKKPDIQDYRDLTLYELSRIIFLMAPENERQEREAEWEGLGSYYRRRLPKEISLNIFNYPNRFDIRFPSDNTQTGTWYVTYYHICRIFILRIKNRSISFFQLNVFKSCSRYIFFN